MHALLGPEVGPNSEELSVNPSLLCNIGGCRRVWPVISVVYEVGRGRAASGWWSSALLSVNSHALPDHQRAHVRREGIGSNISAARIDNIPPRRSVSG